MGVLVGEGPASLATLRLCGRWPWELQQQDGTILGARRYRVGLAPKVVCYTIIATGIYALGADPMPTLHMPHGRVQRTERRWAPTQLGEQVLDYLYRSKTIAGCLTWGFMRSATLPGSTR